MKFVKRVKPSVETMRGPWKAAVRITDDKTATTYKPGDKIPDTFVKKNKWLVAAGRVVGTPKSKKGR